MQLKGKLFYSRDPSLIDRLFICIKTDKAKIPGAHTL